MGSELRFLIMIPNQGDSDVPSTTFLPVTFTSKKFKKGVYNNPYSTINDPNPKGLYCGSMILLGIMLFCKKDYHRPIQHSKGAF